ncbi:hypothetical protein PG990_008934 [Apiospora arundinis]
MDTDHDEEIPLSPTRVPTEERKTTVSRSHSWAPEIAALFCSAAALIALIILLSKEDATRLADWKAPFSLNTVVAILSVVFRTPLAFAVGSCLGQGKWAWFSKQSGTVAVFAAIDEASRGPLGSLQLLWRLKARRFVSFGALATIALIAVDPFLQAIINYEGQLDSENSTNTAFLSRASHLDIGSMTAAIFANSFVDYHDSVYVLSCYHTQPNVGMSASSVLGFVNSSTSNSAKPPLVTCPTGNCTWEPYSTLAFCSSCFDVSAHLKKETLLLGSDECTDEERHGSFHQIPYNITNYTIPYGSSDVHYWGSNGIRDKRGVLNNCGRPLIGKVFVQPRDTYTMQEWNTLLAAFVILRPVEKYNNREIAWENDAVSATECGLRLCTKVFQTTVNNGESHETLLTDAFERVPESFQAIYPNVADQKQVQSNGTIQGWVNDDFGISLASHYPNYNVSGCGILERTNLKLRIPSDVALPREVQRDFNITQASIITIMDGIWNGTQNILDVLSGSTSLATSFENAARLMSYQIRELDNTKHSGVAQKWTTYIRISWPFMILPIAVSLLGFVFSLKIMLESRRYNVQVMKARMLESMLHGLNEETGEKLRNSKVKEKMEEHVFVRLRDGYDGLRLRSPGSDRHDDTETA